MLGPTISVGISSLSTMDAGGRLEGTPRKSLMFGSGSGLGTTVSSSTPRGKSEPGSGRPPSSGMRSVMPRESGSPRPRPALAA